MPFGPSSRAMLWARARRANLAPENAAKCARPRNEAVAPVKMIVPRCLQRTDLTLDAGEEVDHLLLLACVAAAGQSLAALVADGLHQRLQLLRVNPIETIVSS
ncbi:hypothetical protein RLJV_23765 [Pseudomonas aeruginosa]|nr:hypothetical protein RLJV_23765 [Pseudomonas aeruginosa]